MEASALNLGRSQTRSFTGSAPLLRLRSDEQLVALFRAGNDDAFTVIHDRYRARLLAYVRQMLPAGVRRDAEDALQDVFIRAYRALRADERPVTLRAWLYRVAHNRCIDTLRRPAPTPVERMEQEGDDQHNPCDEAERREALQQLVSDLHRLPEAQRSCLLMRELEGLTYAELGDALETSQPAVKSLLVRARMGLADAQEARGADCQDIRADLAASCDRGVRMSARAKLHLRDCQPCTGYHKILRQRQKQVAGLAPNLGPIATALKLIGIGGSSAAAGSGALGGGAAGGGTLAGIAGSGTVAATIAKVAVVVCVAAGTGEVVNVAHQQAVTRRAAAAHATPAATAAPAAAVLAAAPGIRRTAETDLAPAPKAETPAAVVTPVVSVVADAPPTSSTAASTDARANADSGGDLTGGVFAPEEAAPAVSGSLDAAKPSQATTTAPPAVGFVKSTPPTSTGLKTTPAVATTPTVTPGDGSAAQPGTGAVSAPQR